MSGFFTDMVRIYQFTLPTCVSLDGKYLIKKIKRKINAVWYGHCISGGAA